MSCQSLYTEPQKAIPSIHMFLSTTVVLSRNFDPLQAMEIRSSDSTSRSQSLWTISSPDESIFTTVPLLDQCVSRRSLASTLPSLSAVTKSTENDEAFLQRQSPYVCYCSGYRSTIFQDLNRTSSKHNLGSVAKPFTEQYGLCFFVSSMCHYSCYRISTMGYIEFGPIRILNRWRRYVDGSPVSEKFLNPPISLPTYNCTHLASQAMVVQCANYHTIAMRLPIILQMHSA